MGFLFLCILWGVAEEPTAQITVPYGTRSGRI